MNSVNIVIIGGGAAGFFAALRCATLRPQAHITILEAGREALAKVRISGGGRCNVTTAIQDPRQLVRHYPRGGKALLGPFRRFGPRDTVAWFSERGVPLYAQDDGRLFPCSDSSASVIDCFLAEAKRTGITLHTGTSVRSLQHDGQTWQIDSSHGTLRAERILLATGSSRDGYDLAARCGHRLIEPVPSLFALSLSEPWLQTLAGISVEHAEVCAPEHPEVHGQGSLLITHRGISGPAALRASAWGARALAHCDYHCELRINWLGGSEAQLAALFTHARHEHGKQRIGKHSATGLPRRLWQALCQRAEIPDTRSWAELPRREAQALTEQVLRCPVSMHGKRTNADEFVTAGGIALDEVHWPRLASKRAPGCYAAGEILDIDAITGGFNFQAAWSTGFCAGTAMAED